MPIVPQNNLAALQFFEDHWPIWQTNQAACGLSAAQVLAVKTAAELCRSKYNAQQLAKNAAKAATSTFQATLSDLRDVGATTIQVIKTYADTTDNPGVYDLAQIPRPAAPGASLPPGKPKNITATIEPTGALTLRWTCDNTEGDRRATGVFYQVYRKGPGEAQFANVGGSGTRAFTDESLPLGPDSATYIIQGVRGQIAGEASEQFTVQFGVGGGGGLRSIAGTSTIVGSAPGLSSLAA
jgi:hypothetical protein